MPVVAISALSFQYGRKSSRSALSDVSLSIPPGVTGLVGENGAGKSTLLRLIAGMALPVAGTVMIDGTHARVACRTGRIGLIPETPVFDEFLPVGSFLEGITAISGISAFEPGERIQEIWHQPLGQLSLGQKRRVEIAASLLGGPDVLLFDEPTNGLDPTAVLSLRDTIASLNNGNRVVIVSSHHLDELQRLAERIVVLRAGRVVGSWETGAVIEQFGSLEKLYQAGHAHDMTEVH